MGRRRASHGHARELGAVADSESEHCPPHTRAEVEERADAWDLSVSERKGGQERACGGGPLGRANGPRRQREKGEGSGGCGLAAAWEWAAVVGRAGPSLAGLLRLKEGEEKFLFFF